MIKGIVRNTDPLGRVTLPKEMRSSTGIGTERPADIYLDNGVICIEPAVTKSEHEYKIEKKVHGEWHHEGQGALEYVNRAIPYLVKNGFNFRIVEVNSAN